MNCNHARGLFSAWIDQQLESAIRNEFEDHLRDCAECRAAADGTRELHTELLRAFAGPRAAAARSAERVIAALPGLATTGQSPRPAGRPGWTLTGLAMAVGFLAAVLIFPPWKPRQAASDSREGTRDGTAGKAASLAATMPDPVARLVVATSPTGVEYNDRSAEAWQAVADPLHFQCPSEGSVRTSQGARCELMTATGCVVRMNAGTEVVFHSPERVELKRGEIWCRSTPQAPLEVVPSLAATASGGPRPDPAPSTVCCTAADAACLLCATDSGEKVRVTAAAGSISVQAPQASLQLNSSETATITRERIDRNPPADRLLAASWMQPLLIRKGHTDRELVERVDELFARIGQSPQSEIYESEIRSLGEYGLLPLLKYVESPHAESDGNRRLIAMRMISDLAPPWAIGELVKLLRHSDADVRALAAAALVRLTNQTQGVSSAAWHSDPAEWETAAAAWQTWWSRNSDRYPPRPSEPRL